MVQSEKLYLRARELISSGIAPSKPTLYRWIARGQFPKPIKLAVNGTSVFRKSEVDAWLAAREVA